MELQGRAREVVRQHTALVEPYRKAYAFGVGGIIHIIPFWPHAMISTGNPSDPWYLTATSSPAGLSRTRQATRYTRRWIQGNLCQKKTEERKPGRIFPLGKTLPSTHTICAALLTNAANRTLPLRGTFLHAHPAYTPTPIVSGKFACLRNPDVALRLYAKGLEPGAAATARRGQSTP